MEIIRLRERNTGLETCPKCHSKIELGSTECLSCGVLFPKVLATLEDRLQSDYRSEFGQEFVDQWQIVLNDYENEEVHWKFISFCQQFRALEFAAYRYKKMADVINDDIAHSMLKRISALALVDLEETKNEWLMDSRRELFRVPRVVFALCCFVCGAAMMMGLIAPTQYSLFGWFGAFLLFALMLLRFVLQNFDQINIREILQKF